MPSTLVVQPIICQLEWLGDVTQYGTSKYTSSAVLEGKKAVLRNRLMNGDPGWADRATTTEIDNMVQQMMCAAEDTRLVGGRLSFYDPGRFLDLELGAARAGLILNAR